LGAEAARAGLAEAGVVKKLELGTASGDEINPPEMSAYHVVGVFRERLRPILGWEFLVFFGLMNGFAMYDPIAKRYSRG
jgi:hypothetical protein